MGANEDMRNKAGGNQGSNELPAPYILPTGTEDYPSGVINEVLGGPHIYDDIDDCVNSLHRKKMHKGMTITINQHLSGGDTIKRTRYYLETVPSIDDNETISDIPGYDFNAYFTIDRSAISNVEGTQEVQFAADYLGAKPLFSIGATWYNNGEASDVDTTVIWSSIYDAKKPHIWQRQRYGATSDWGIPVKVFGEAYEEGQFLDSKFQWVLKVNPAPDKPLQIINGEINNNPIGWDDTPDNFPDTDYDTSILTYDLYRIIGLKDVNGDLKGHWDGPLLISDDPNLVRFGAVGNNSDFLNDTFWRAYYTPEQDKFMASREDLGGGNFSEWIVSQIDDENGEYFDFVFKAFPLGTVVTDADKPTIKEPYTLVAPNDWSNNPVTSADNEIQYQSKIRKTIQGDMIGEWSTPTRWDGQDTIQTVISSDNGTIFKYTDGGAVPSPTEIILTAKLFRGITEITTGLTYKWYKGIIDIGNELVEVTNQLTIVPADVDDVQIYNAVVTFEGNTYPDEVTLVDVTDGADFVAYINADDGFTFKAQAGTKTFNPEFYNNGILNNTGVTFVWKLDGVIQTDSDSGSGSQNVDPTTKQITITGTDIVTSAVLKLEATYNSTTYERSETIVDLEDGKATVIEYSTDPITTNPAAVSNWTSTPTGANWMRVSTDGGATFGSAILIRGENGTKEGGLTLFIYKNIQDGVDPVPTAPAVPASGSIVPSGWTDSPTAFTGNQDVTYMTSCNFVLVSDGDSSVLTRANWTPLTATYGTPVKITGKDGVAIGVPGIDGDNGEKGWSPVFAVVPDGTTREVLELVDWVGGEGTKPAYGNLYVSTTGLVSTKTAAANIKGGDGIDGEDGEDGVLNGANSVWGSGVSTSSSLFNTWGIARGLTSARPSTGTYDVNHTYGSLNYHVSVSAITQGDIISVSSQSANKITFKVTGHDGVLKNNGFYFKVTEY